MRTSLNILMISLSSFSTGMVVFQTLEDEISEYTQASTLYTTGGVHTIATKSFMHVSQNPDIIDNSILIDKLTTDEIPKHPEYTTRDIEYNMQLVEFGIDFIQSDFCVCHLFLLMFITCLIIRLFMYLCSPRCSQKQKITLTPIIKPFKMDDKCIVTV